MAEHMQEPHTRSGVWVTGATGFIGSRFLRFASECEVSVVAHSRRSSATSDLTKEPCVDAWSFGDLKDGGVEWPEGIQVGTTLHLASPSAWTLLGDPKVYEIILSSVKAVFEQSIRAGSRHFIYVSSASALGGYFSKRDWEMARNHQTVERHRFPYAAAKRDAEVWLRDRCATEGIRLSVVYPGETYGRDDVKMVTAGSVLEMISSRVCLVTNGGTHVAAVDDVARALLRIVQSDEPARVLLASDFLEFRDLARIARQRAKANGAILCIPNWVVSFGLKLRQRLGIDLIGHPDAAVTYGQVYWEATGDSELTSHDLSFQSARKSVEEVTDWLISRNS